MKREREIKIEKAKRITNTTNANYNELLKVDIKKERFGGLSVYVRKQLSLGTFRITYNE